VLSGWGEISFSADLLEKGWIFFFAIYLENSMNFTCMTIYKMPRILFIFL
jgi:hypothetical protein